MMDDLSKSEFEGNEAESEALDIADSPFLDKYILARGLGETPPTNPIRLIMKDQPGYVAPTSVFMIYMRFDATGELIVRQLRYQDFGDDGRTLEQAEEDLLAIAQAAPFAGPHAVGTNFKDMRWTRPYFMTFVIDNPGWKFYWGVDQRHEAIRFLERKDAQGNFQIYEDENHSFFDAEQGIALGHGEAFRCRNYHRDANGPLLDARAVKYCFEIYLQSPFKVPTGNSTHITVLIDPDGQNQGPRT